MQQSRLIGRLIDWWSPCVTVSMCMRGWKGASYNRGVYGALFRAHHQDLLLRLDAKQDDTCPTWRPRRRPRGSLPSLSGRVSSSTLFVNTVIVFRKAQASYPRETRHFSLQMLEWCNSRNNFWGSRLRQGIIRAPCPSNGVFGRVANITTWTTLD